MASNVTESKIFHDLSNAYCEIYFRKVLDALRQAVSRSRYSKKFTLFNIWPEKALLIIFLHAIDSEDVGLAGLVLNNFQIPDIIDDVKVLPLEYCCSQYSIPLLARHASQIKKSKLLAFAEEVLNVLMKLPKDSSKPLNPSTSEVITEDEIISHSVFQTAYITLKASLKSKIEESLKYTISCSKFSLKFTLQSLWLSKGLFLIFLYGLIKRDCTICDPVFRLFPMVRMKDDVEAQELAQTVLNDFNFSPDEILKACEFYSLYRKSTFITVPEDFHSLLSSFFGNFVGENLPSNSDNSLYDLLKLSNNKHLTEKSSSSCEPSSSSSGVLLDRSAIADASLQIVLDKNFTILTPPKKENIECPNRDDKVAARIPRLKSLRKELRYLLENDEEIHRLVTEIHQRKMSNGTWSHEEGEGSSMENKIHETNMLPQNGENSMVVDLCE